MDKLPEEILSELENLLDSFHGKVGALVGSGFGTSIHLFTTNALSNELFEAASTREDWEIKGTRALLWAEYRGSDFCEISECTIFRRPTSMNEYLEYMGEGDE